MTPNSDGPDLSRWNPVGDWDAIPQFRLFITKATGTSKLDDVAHVDPTFHANWSQMRRRGFEFRGCYHWLRSDIPIVDQVELLHDTLAVHGGLQPGEFVMLDWETTPGTQPPTFEQVEEWLLRAWVHWPGRVIVYCSDWVPDFVEWRNRNPEHPLFYANYNLTDPVHGGWAEVERWGADVWQWTSSAAIPGVNDPTCDMNHVVRWETLAAIAATGGDTMYPDGWGNPPRQLTLDQVDARHHKLNAEFRRRVLSMMEACPNPLGIGESARSSAVQERVFRERHVAYTSPPGIRWDGSYWRKKPGVAAAAPPGSSYHEDDIAGGALAVDMIGDLKWAKAAASSFGLREFSQVNNEPWHFQPAEIPTARRNYDGSPLAFYPTPGTTTPPTTNDEVDMIAIDYRPGTPEWTALTYTGTHLAHVVNGHADQVVRAAGVQRVEVSDVQLDGLIQSAQTTTNCPAAWVNTPRGAAWTAQRG